MGFTSKLLVTALSAAATAYASGCSATTTTLKSGGDAQAIATCTTFSGSIVIETGVASGGGASLDGIKKITGGLTYENDNTTQTFSASSLESLGDSLIFQNLSSLTTITLTKLTQSSNIIFNGLGSLTDLGFTTADNTSGGLQSTGDVTIVNTQISSLQGLQNVTQIGGFKIVDNPYLSDISFMVDKISSIIVGPNDVSGSSGVHVNLPNLTTSDLIDIENCSSVLLPSLESVSSSFSLKGNTFQSFMAPKLIWTGDLVIQNNGDLKNMSFPALSAINNTNSTLNVANNTKLMQIGGFGDLQTVTGDVSLAGNFSQMSFPKIHSVGGAFEVDTASSSFDCSSLPGNGHQVVKGSQNCHIGDKTKVGGSSTGTTSGGGSSSFAYPLEIPSSFMPIFPLIAGLLFA